MKSSSQQLSSRGYLPKEAPFDHSLERTALYTQLNDPDPVERSLAARFLGDSFILQEGTAEKLLERLCIEKKLYTRMELCDALAKGNGEVAAAMIPYLNRLGNKQYRSIAEANTSKKKSYPLPRGLIARTFGGMKPTVADRLLRELEQQEYAAELIEGLGYLVFNNPELQTAEIFDRASDFYVQYKNNLLFVWKFVIFSSAFPYSCVKEMLTEIEREFPEEAIQREIKRTTVISKNR